MTDYSLPRPVLASPIKIAFLSAILLSLLLSSISLNSEAELSQTTNSLNLSCLSETSCLLDNSESGVDMISSQESSASPLSPKIVTIEFLMNPEQSHLALLPSKIDELVIDLRIQEDNAGISSPDIVVDFWAGRSSNSWTLEGGSPTSPKLGDYRLEDAELDLSLGRLVRPGDGVGLSISFEISEPVTWELYLRGSSRIIIPIEWSADIATENIDEPSSAGNPVQISDVETLTKGALLDADQDCFKFALPEHLRSMTIIVYWTSVPIEIEQPHTPPELIREGGKTPKNPAVKTTYEAGEQITEIHYEDPLEGDYLACWSGKNNHFQSYSWFARLSYEGLGSASPSEFSGDANWLAGEAFVGNYEDVSPIMGSNSLTLVVGILGTAVAFAGFALPTNNLWLKKYLLPMALLLLIVGGIASPVWGLTDEAPLTGEMTLDEVLAIRMGAIEDSVHSDANISIASNFFGIESGDTFSLRLHVTESHPTGDGRWQVHTEEMANIRIDSYVFGWLADHPMGDDEEVRFILQTGRALTLDLLMLEALLVVDEKPEGELLHVKWKMTSSEPGGSATEPIWSSRPDSISSSNWKKLQSDLYPQLLTISYCDCGIDGMEVSWRSSDNFDESSIPEIEGISNAGGFVSNEYLWLASGFALLLIAGGIEYYGVKKTEKLDDDFF
ncbi:MAG: hypothetical protein QF544_05300 [Candidatus Thalassarchaeaceae archaeon]|nr:hypothetical protein [Candidatus Thalassarchaeaceae archaeon]